ncbi:Type-1 restriction enzyme EcoKI specificity protein [subsurface metagenome]
MILRDGLKTKLNSVGFVTTYLTSDWKVSFSKEILSINDSGIWGADLIDSENGIEVLRSTNIQNNKWIFQNIAIRSISNKEFQKKCLTEGDILVTKSSGSKKHIGKSAFVDKIVENRKAVFSNFMQRIRFNNQVDNKYAFFFMADYGRKILLNNSTTTTGLRNLKKQDFENIPIPIPPLSEQKKIAYVLSTIQEAKEKTEAVIEATKELKKSLMKYLFTYGPVPVEGAENVKLKETEIGMIPNEWEFDKLNDVCESIVDCPHSTPHFKYSGILCVRNFNISDCKLKLKPSFFTTEIEYRERVKRLVPKEGDVLLSREAPVGEACVIPPNIKLSLGQRIMLIRTDMSKLLNRYLTFLFYAPYMKALLMSMASGVTAKHINVGDVRRLKIPLPKIKIQSQISDVSAHLNSPLSAHIRYPFHSHHLV